MSINKDAVSVNPDDTEIILNKDKPVDIRRRQQPTPELANSLENLKLSDFPVTLLDFSTEKAESEEGLAETILFYKWLK